MVNMYTLKNFESIINIKKEHSEFIRDCNKDKFKLYKHTSTISWQALSSEISMQGKGMILLVQLSINCRTGCCCTDFFVFYF